MLRIPGRVLRPESYVQGGYLEVTNALAEVSIIISDTGSADSLSDSENAVMGYRYAD